MLPLPGYLIAAGAPSGHSVFGNCLPENVESVHAAAQFHWDVVLQGLWGFYLSSTISFWILAAILDVHRNVRTASAKYGLPWQSFHLQYGISVPLLAFN